MTRVLLVGGRFSVDGMKGILAGASLSAVESAPTLDVALRLIDGPPGLAIDLLLMDCGSLLAGDETDLLLRLRSGRRGMKQVLLAAPGALDRLARSCGPEIDGCLPNTMRAGELSAALCRIVRGHPGEPPDAAREMFLREEPAGVRLASLSFREREILALLVEGFSNKVIARDLAISHETVKVHMKALLRKLKAQNRTQAAIWGLQNGTKEPGQKRLGLDAPCRPDDVSSVGAISAREDH
jgi:two-component system nitrate/nitrite response regulator NarL